MVRKYNGRKKIEMVKMKNETNLQVTFSKRKSGLFKKASELCMLCNAEVALIVFSPSGKIYSFGHPNVDALVDRLSRRSQSSVSRHSHNTEVVESNTNSHLQDLKMLVQVLAEKEKEKEKKNMNKSIANERLNNNSDNWYQKPPEELSLTQAIHMKHIAEDLKKKIDDLHSQFQQRIIPHQKYHIGSSSSVDPGTIYGGTSHTNHNLLDQNIRMDTNAFNYDPNMIVFYESSLFGYNHDNNNISERSVPECAVNRTPWYKHSQIQSQESEQGYHQYGPRYY